MNNKNGFSVDYTTQQSRMIVRSIIAFIILLLMVNLGAIIDAILHPEIAYFDSEHIIVGASSVFVVGIMMAIITVYIERIEKMLRDNKQAEESLRKSEERYHTLFQQASDGIFYLSTDGKVVVVNESFARMHGYSVEEMQGMNLQDLDTPENAQQIPERMRRVMAGEVVEFETEHYHKDGHVFSLVVSTGLISVGGEQLIQAFHQDITARKQAQDALQENENRYRKISEMISDYAYSFRVEDGNQLAQEWVTESFVRITGYTSDEMNERDGWGSIIHPDDIPIALERSKHLFAGQPDTSVFRIFRKDGAIRWLRDYGQPIWDETQNRVVRIYGAAEDITERKQAEEKLGLVSHNVRV